MILNKNFIIVALIGIITILLYFMFCEENVTVDDSFYVNRQKQLHKERDSLEFLLNVEGLKSKSYEVKVDSLERLKSKVKYVYIEKNKKIDSASVSGVISEFEHIFAASDIK